MIPPAGSSTTVPRRPPGNKQQLHRQAAGVSEARELQRGHVTREADGLARRGYLTVEMRSQSPPLAAPAPAPFPSSCPGGAGEFKVAAVARLFPALAVGWPEIISSSSPFSVDSPSRGRADLPGCSGLAGSLAGWSLPPGCGRTDARTLTSPEAWRKTRGCDWGGGRCRSCSPHQEGRGRRCAGFLTYSMLPPMPWTICPPQPAF